MNGHSCLVSSISWCPVNRRTRRCDADRRSPFVSGTGAVSERSGLLGGLLVHVLLLLRGSARLDGVRSAAVVVVGATVEESHLKSPPLVLRREPGRPSAAGNYSTNFYALGQWL